MIVVVETKDGFKPISGRMTLTSLDGEERAPLRTILHASWSEEDRARFGIYLAEPMSIPEDKEPLGSPRYERDHTGKVIEVYDLQNRPRKPPTPLTARQLRLALLQAGYLASVETAIDAITDGMVKAAVRIDWEYATRFERDNVQLIALAAAIGMSEADVDALWSVGLAL